MEATHRRRVVLDAYPLVALLRREPCWPEVASLLRESGCVISSVTLGEASDVLVRVHLREGEHVAAVLESLLDDLIEVETLTAETAVRAGLVRARLYRRRERELSLADCVVLATAREGDAIATADPVLADAARQEGVDVVALPDSSGRRP